MYMYGIERKVDALKHVLEQGGDILIGCGDSNLGWDGIYGSVVEYQSGKLVARHYPQIDYGRWDGQSFHVKGWTTRTY